MTPDTRETLIARLELAASRWTSAADAATIREAIAALRAATPAGEGPQDIDAYEPLEDRMRRSLARLEGVWIPDTFAEAKTAVALARGVLTDALRAAAPSPRREATTPEPKIASREDVKDVYAEGLAVGMDLGRKLGAAIQCGKCGGTQFETLPVQPDGIEVRCLTCGEQAAARREATTPDAAVLLAALENYCAHEMPPDGSVPPDAYTEDDHCRRCVEFRDKLLADMTAAARREATTGETEKCPTCGDWMRCTEDTPTRVTWRCDRCAAAPSTPQGEDQ